MKHLDAAIKNLATTHDRAALEAAAERIRAGRRGTGLDATLALEAVRIGRTARGAGEIMRVTRDGLVPHAPAAAAPTVDVDAARRNVPTLVETVRRAWARDDVAGASRAARIAAHAAKAAGLELPEDVVALGNDGRLLPTDIG